MIEKRFGVHGELIPDRCVIPKTRQVHGVRVAHVTETCGESVLEADAFITTTPGVLCAVVTADCVPVLIWDRQERVVGAVHAGWRGVAAGIVPNAIASMRRLVPDAELCVAMGPAMGPKCYEVGQEVVDACAATVPDIAPYVVPTRPGHYYIDLKGILTEQLCDADVARDAITCHPDCTHCDTRYASYRRGDRNQRQHSWIIINR